MEGHKRQQHGKGNGQAHQYSVAHTHDKKEYHNDQDQACDNVVLQVGHHDPDLLGPVHELGHLGPGRPCGHLFLDDQVDLFGYSQHVLTSAFFDLDVNGLAAVQTSPALFVFEPVYHPGHVL